MIHLRSNDDDWFVAIRVRDREGKWNHQRLGSENGASACYGIAGQILSIRRSKCDVCAVGAEIPVQFVFQTLVETEHSRNHRGGNAQCDKGDQRTVTAAQQSAL